MPTPRYDEQARPEASQGARALGTPAANEAEAMQPRVRPGLGSFAENRGCMDGLLENRDRGKPQSIKDHAALRQQLVQGSSGQIPDGVPSNAFKVLSAATEEQFFLLEMSPYIKDTHWVTEKNMLLAEKNMMLLDEIREGQSAAAAPAVEVDYDRIDKMIRESVFQAVQSMDSKRVAQAPQPGLPPAPVVQMTGDRSSADIALQQLGAVEKALEKNAEFHQRALEKHFRVIEDHQDAVDRMAEKHGTALDFMLQKIDEFNILVQSLWAQPLGPLSEKTPRGAPILDSVYVSGEPLLAHKDGERGHAARNEALALDRDKMGLENKPQDALTEARLAAAAAGKNTNVASREDSRLQGSEATDATPLDPVEEFPELIRGEATKASLTSQGSNEPEENQDVAAAIEEVIKKAEVISDVLEQEKNKKKEVFAPVQKDDAEKEDVRSWGEKFVSGSAFEMVFAFLIILNTVNMCVSCEYQGVGVGYSLGDPDGKATTAEADYVFFIIEIVFGVVFTSEVVMKGMALRCRFWKSAWNVFDFGIISLAWFDMTGVGGELPVNPMLLRLVRLVRLCRLLKGLQKFELFDNLSLMVRGIRASTPLLLWVVILIFPMLACCGLGINYMVVDYINDETKLMAHRVECYKYFGTFLKAFFSMFEVTFASWVPIARFLYNHVDERFALFFMGYKLVMGIAVLRIIYGVFLHVTFACATNDEEVVIAKKNRENAQYAERMHEIFQQFDSSGDGYLTKDEFLQIVVDPRVKTLLSALELEINDAELVFDLTDDGDGKVGAEEMVYSFSRLKGAARSVDVLALTTLTKEAIKKIDTVLTLEGAIEADMIGHKHKASSSILSVEAKQTSKKKDRGFKNALGRKDK